jgi:hypothetical protein
VDSGTDKQGRSWQHSLSRGGVSARQPMACRRE